MKGNALLVLFSLTLINVVLSSFDQQVRHGYRATSKIRVDSNIISVTSSNLHNHAIYALTQQQHVLLINEESGKLLQTHVLPREHQYDKIRSALCQHSDQSCVYLWKSKNSSEQKSGKWEIYYFNEEQDNKMSPEVNSFNFKSVEIKAIYDIYGENGHLWITGEKQDGSLFQTDVNSKKNSEQYRKSQVPFTALSQSHKGVIFMNMTSVHIASSANVWTQFPSLILNKNQYGQVFIDADWTNDGFVTLLKGKHLHVLHYKQDKSALMVMDEASRCLDKALHACEAWKNGGLCRTNARVRTELCLKTCGMCRYRTSYYAFPSIRSRYSVNHKKAVSPTSTNCFDKNSNCRSWSLTGMCDRKADYMQKNCPKTCDMCSSMKSVTTGCYDSNSLCKTWAAAGRCNEEASRGFMKQNCKKSCEVCTSTEKISMATCIDKSSSCKAWAEAGRCEPNRGYMKENCALSCDFCPHNKIQLESKQQCEDKSKHCPSWAAADKCKTRADYMYTNCMKSCGLCDRTQQKQNTEPACQDDNEFCLVWASHDFCSIKSKYMSQKCRLACGVCKQIPDSRSDNGRCSNRNEFCETWKEYDLCEKKPKFMKDNCPKSCGECDNQGRYKQKDELEKEKPCEDFNDNCEIWSKNNYCSKYTAYMNSNCPASCGVCQKHDADTCIDKNEDCKSWADQGQCDFRSDYMMENCRASCTSCSDDSHSTGAGNTHHKNNRRDEKQHGERENDSQSSTEEEELVACEDKSEFCSLWQTAGRCKDKEDYMKYYCPKSCAFCSGSETENSGRVSDNRNQQGQTTTPTTTTVKTTTIKTTTTQVTTPATELTSRAEDGNCVDTNTRCESWSVAGYCPRYERYMRDNCKKSCNFCQSNKLGNTTPKPTTPRPITRRIIVQNPTTRAYYGSNECKDNHSFCTTWANQGRCKIRADFMLRMCKKSCGAC